MNPYLNSTSDPFVTRQTIQPYSEGILSGLSFAVKDNIDIKNQTTGYGSPAWAGTHHKPVSNAICLEQLLCEGGVFKGKTKTDELAYSLMGLNGFYGTPVNPNAPDRVPGGSSSGSASAVAGGRVDFAIGTDTGGSVRVPASNCGVWGYRPSHGAISVSGVLPLAPSFDTVGVVSSSGNILEKIMGVLLSEDVFKNRALPSVCFVDDVFRISGTSVLHATKFIFDNMPDVYNHRTLSLSEILGMDLCLDDLFFQLGFLLSTEIWNTFGSWVKSETPILSLSVEHSLKNYAESADRRDIQRILFARKTFQKKLNEFLSAGNILCFPTTADPAPRLEDISPAFFEGDYVPRSMGINAISSLSGTPQITIPVNRPGEVPIGISFLAGYGQDMLLIDLCNRIYSQCFC